MAFVTTAMVALGTSLGASASTAAATGVAATSLATTAIAGGVSAYGQRQQGKAAKAGAKYNAELLEGQAAADRSTSLENMTRLRRHNGRALGEIRSQLGASGIVGSEGSALDTLEESEELLELRILDQAKAAENRGRGFANQRRATLFGGELAQSAANSRARSTLMRTASSIGRSGYQFHKEGILF